MRVTTAIGLVFVCAAVLDAQAPGRPVTFARADAGSVRTDLGYDVVVNQGSSLQRQAVTAQDARLPASFVGDAVVTTSYRDREYYFATKFDIKAAQALSAVEVRFLLFDVFGDRMTVLSTTEVLDIVPGGIATMEARWDTWENQVSEYLASLAFIARVRTRTGQVVEADLAPILAEASKFAKRLTMADLAPRPDAKP